MHSLPLKLLTQPREHSESFINVSCRDYCRCCWHSVLLFRDEETKAHR